MHTEVLAGLVYVMRMVNGSMKLKEHLRQSDRELQKTQRKLKVSSGTILKAQKLALSKAEKACSCRQLLECVKEQLYLAREQVTSVEAADVEAAVRSKG